MPGQSDEVSVYIGLGSNLGDRAERIRHALALLDREPSVHVVRASALYESAPLGHLEQPAFLNAVAELRTSLEPEALLHRMKKLELLMGRQPAPHWGPRAIDLDILIYSDRQIRTELLRVPHPLMPDRAFVLMPLAELWPDCPLANGSTAQERLGELLKDQPVRKYEDMGSWAGASASQSRTAEACFPPDCLGDEARSAEACPPSDCLEDRR